MSILRAHNTYEPSLLWRPVCVLVRSMHIDIPFQNQTYIIRRVQSIHNKKTSVDSHDELTSNFIPFSFLQNPLSACTTTTTTTTTVTTITDYPGILLHCYHEFQRSSQHVVIRMDW